MTKALEIKNGVATLIDRNGDTHTFKNGREILTFTENVGMFGLYEMFGERQVDFLMNNGKA
jgi:hypothetical protein